MIPYRWDQRSGHLYQGEQLAATSLGGAIALLLNQGQQILTALRAGVGPPLEQGDVALPYGRITAQFCGAAGERRDVL